MPTTALIVAAGAGLRMGLPSPKAFLDLSGRPIVEHSLKTFDAHPLIDAIILVAPASHVGQAERIASGYGKVRRVAPGGTRRQDSVKLGLDGLRRMDGSRPPEGHLVLVHDAARPLVNAALIASVIEAAARTGAAFPGLVPSDTVRETAGGEGRREPSIAARTLDRRSLVLVQTPQGFRLSILLDAYDLAGGEEVTDDAALVQRLGHQVEVVPGSPRNVKITTADDLGIAEALLATRGGSSGRAGR